MYLRTTLLLLLAFLFAAFDIERASAGPPVSNESEGWVKWPDLSKLTPTMPKVEFPSFGMPSFSQTGKESPLTATPRRAWRAVSGGIERSWRWSKQNLNPFATRGGATKSETDEPGFWERLAYPQPEKRVDSVTDFLGQPRPY